MILLVRHGRTRANASGLLQGRADPPLDELGRAQAAALATVLPRRAAVITSPLTRARQTAAVIAEAGGGEVVVDERWIELDYGEWDGLPLGEVPAEAWQRWRADIGFAPPGGESLAGCGERVRQVCAELAERAEDQDIVVVSHVSPIKAAVAWALGVGDETSWRMFLSVASICRISVGERGTSLRSYNEQAHLEGVSHPVRHEDSRR